MINARLTAIGEDMVPAADQERYQRWIRARVGPALTALGLPGGAGDTDERHSRRAELLALVGIAGNDPDVQRRARELAAQYMANPSSLPGTSAPAVLRVAAVGGDAALYAQYVAQIEKHTANPRSTSASSTRCPISGIRRSWRARCSTPSHPLCGRRIPAP
ncbi:MAG: hypothetical protein FJW14_06480 [Acidimicrobiia bacterium]|nr:hypothetical protein [Acidimicrobiia bacterium]